MNRLFKAFFFLIVLLIIGFFTLRNPDIPIEELKKKYTDDESEWVTINGMETHYKKEGSGPAVVLIHGTGASLHTWDDWTDELINYFTVYRMDLPAFGLTGPAPDADYTIEAYIDFIDDFTIAQGIDSFAIGGNSLGGTIAWAYTVEHPSKVDQLILLDAGGYPQEGQTEALAFKIATNPILSPLMKHITPKSFIEKNLIQVYSDDSKVTDGLITRYHDMTLRSGNRQAFIDRVHTKHSDISIKIREITCPTLIQWGEEDSWVDLNNAHRFDRDISNSKLIIYPEVGHVPMEEAPDVTVQDALDFLLSK